MQTILARECRGVSGLPGGTQADVSLPDSCTQANLNLLQLRAVHQGGAATVRDEACGWNAMSINNTELQPGDLPASLVFVHISKAGGSSIKRAMKQHAEENHLPEPTLVFHASWSEFKQDCGLALPAMCNKPLYYGTKSLGACDWIKKRPCRYFTQLRDPIARMTSHYNYFCTEGAEGKLGWLPGWTHCEMTLDQWTARYRLHTLLDLTVPDTSGKLEGSYESGGCKCTYAGCEEPWQERELLDRAKDNLRSGAVVPLLLEEPDLSSQYLLKKLGFDLRDSIGQFHENDHGSHTSVSCGDGTQSTCDAMKNLLQLDISLYNFARSVVLD